LGGPLPGGAPLLRALSRARRAGRRTIGRGRRRERRGRRRERRGRGHGAPGRPPLRRGVPPPRSRPSQQDGRALPPPRRSPLPAAVLLIVWWKKGRIAWRDAAPQIPLLVVGGFFGLMTSWLEKHHVGAQGAEWSLSAVGRVLVAGRALWFYAGKLLWPSPLIFVYPRWSMDAAGAAAFLFPAAFIAVVVPLIALSGRIGRGPPTAALFFSATPV